jgi:DNA-binding response OmpR family regulator
MEFKQRAELMAMLICPNRGLAQQFLATIPETRSFQVVGDLQQYPNSRQLDARLRQSRPDVVLLDLSADTEVAIGLIGVIAAFRPSIYVVGLHESNDASVIIRSLRAGSTEFLCFPFDVDSQSTVITRILRLRESEERGAKAGQGATTLAFQMASIASQDGKRKVLLADFDTTGGTVSFAARLSHSYSVLDAIRHSEKLDSALWNALVNNKNGLDILVSPDQPEMNGVEGHKVHEVIEYARSAYEDVILDLPSAYERISQVSIGEADKVFLVCNAELPHFT